MLQSCYKFLLKVNLSNYIITVIIQMNDIDNNLFFSAESEVSNLAMAMKYEMRKNTWVFVLL